MQILASSLSLSAQSLSYRSLETRQRLEMWTGGRPPSLPDASAAPPSADASLFRSLSAAAKAHAAPPSAVPAAAPAPEEQGLDPETERILYILEKLFGMKGARRMVMKMQAVQQQLGQARADAQTQAQQPARAGWGLTYDSTTTRTSYESASLSADGKLTLADGSSLAFHLDWSQSSLRVEQSSTHLALGDARLSDPLAIDLDGNGLAFAGSMPLALGAAGTATVARPAGGDALLVRDANGNGRVDAGEVLGAATGQAFAELAQLDGDRNGWIDQGDAAWSQLRLLDGSGGLRPLDGSVAAIATASVSLPYEHRDADGILQAVGRRGGVVITADGGARAAAQVDLVV